jgi:predicted PurR-regulated permease PerM/phosphoglycolate phosphatase-like HAD superfamily hydrolase
MTSKRWSTTTKIIVAAILAVLAVVLLITFRAMVRPTIIAFLLTFILYQPVNWVQRRTAWSRGVCIIAVYLIVIVLLLAAPVIFIPRLVESFESLMTVLQELVIDLQTASPAPVITLGDYEISVNVLFQQLGELLQNILSPAAAGALGFAITITTTILTTVYVLVLGFWLLKDMSKLQRTVIEALPTDYREDIQRLGRELIAIWSAFLRGQFALAIVIGLITWVVMSIVGLPNAAGLALLAGVMEFLPTVGPGISGAVGTLVALFQGSTWLPVNNFVFALIVLALYIVITQVESVYLIPRLVGRRVHLHPAVTFAGIISGAVVFGVLGVLLSTPTIASIRLLLIYVSRKLRDLEPFRPAYIQSEVRIPGLIAGHRIEAVVFDLDGTLTELDWSFADHMARRTHYVDRLWNYQQRYYFFQRFMVAMEGLIARWIALLSWLQLHDDVHRMLPYLNWVRGYPPAEELKLRPGVDDLLLELSQQYRLGLMTSRSCAEVNTFLRNSGLPATLFGSIVTRETTQDVTFQNKALQQLHVDADRLLVVSDSILRLRSAQAIGAVQCGVAGDPGGVRSFSDTDLILASPTELKQWL